MNIINNKKKTQPFLVASKMDRAKMIISSVASVAATAMVARSMIRDYLPYEIQDYFFSSIRSFFNHFSSQITMVIEEFDGFESNQLYEAIDTYLATVVPADTKRLKARKPEKLKNITVAVERDQEIIDSFEGVKFKWILICTKTESKNFYNPGDINSTLRSEVRSFELCFHKKNRIKVINSYLPSILEKSKSLKQDTKALKIFTVNGAQMYGNLHDAWTSVNLDHPGTFDTLAMDSEIKNTIVQDLDRFIERKDFYRKVGKAWKRGYLLYGPPGTGKSSLIAAMANYLKFDIYDLELTELRSNSELRRLLVSTANRSILVVEDIDCTIELQDRLAVEAGPSRAMGFDREQKVTLSGLLNFIDGLWSSCGDERIIVFTTNHKDKLDAALLRPGRMDVHIHMSYCTPCGFRLLVSNYLGIDNHQLLKEIEEMIQSIQVTPAEVAEQLMKSDEPQVVLEGLIEFLKVKKENEAANAKKLENLEPMEIVLGKVVKSDQSAIALEELHEFVKVGKKEKEEAKGKEVEDGTNG